MADLLACSLYSSTDGGGCVVGGLDMEVCIQGAYGAKETLISSRNHCIGLDMSFKCVQRNKAGDIIIAMPT